MNGVLVFAEREVPWRSFARTLLLAIAAVIVLSFAVHLLPWLLAAVAILALVKFWPRRSHR